MAKKSFKEMMKEKTENLPSNRLSSENNIKQSIVVLQDLKNLIPSLRPDEKEQLRDNVLLHGITDPLTLWETTVQTIVTGLAEDAPDRQLFKESDNDELIYVLIDGHNRYAIAKEHGKDFRINIMKFDGLEQVKDYMINYQLGRRNLNVEQISYLRGLRYNHLKKSVSGSNKFGGDVADELAKEYQVSKRTITRDAEFAGGLEKLQSDLKQDILTGVKKVSKKTIATLSNGSFTELLNEKALDSYVDAGGLEQISAPKKSPEVIVLDTFLEKSSKNKKAASALNSEKIIAEIKRTVNQEDLHNVDVLAKLEQFISLLKNK